MTEVLSCPYCGSTSITKIYRPEVYEFRYICRKCDEGFNNPVMREADKLDDQAL